MNNYVRELRDKWNLDKDELRILRDKSLEAFFDRNRESVKCLSVYASLMFDGFIDALFIGDNYIMGAFNMESSESAEILVISNLKRNKLYMTSYWDKLPVRHRIDI